MDQGFEENTRGRKSRDRVPLKGHSHEKSFFKKTKKQRVGLILLQVSEGVRHDTFKR
jgi:hypothetical protein